MIIEAVDLYTGNKLKWEIPSKEEAIKHSVATWGEKYDRVEREVVKGGLPIVFKRV